MRCKSRPMNGYVCSETGERLCLLQLTLSTSPLPWKPVNLFTIVIVTHNLGPRRLNPERQLFPCLGGCAPGRAGCRPQAPAARVAPRARLAQAHTRFPRLGPALPVLPWRWETRVRLDGCQRRLVGFRKPSHFCLFLSMWERFSYHSVPIGGQTPKPAWAASQSKGVRASQVYFPAARRSHRQRRALPSNVVPNSLPPAIPDAAERHVVWEQAKLRTASDGRALVLEDEPSSWRKISALGQHHSCRLQAQCRHQPCYCPLVPSFLSSPLHVAHGFSNLTAQQHHVGKASGFDFC